MGIAKKRAPRFRVGDVVSFFRGVRWVTGQVIEDRGRLGAFDRRYYRVHYDLGEGNTSDTEIPEEDLEKPSDVRKDPPSDWPRQEFDVRYVRRGKSNSWDATVQPGKVYGVTATGAVAYIPERRDGEFADVEDIATVAVFLERDPRLGDPLPPAARTALEAEARRLADRKFKTRHPDAVIEPAANDEA